MTFVTWCLLLFPVPSFITLSSRERCGFGGLGLGIDSDAKFLYQISHDDVESAGNSWKRFQNDTGDRKHFQISDDWRKRGLFRLIRCTTLTTSLANDK